MSSKYKQLYDFVNIAKVFCSLIAAFYVVYWFLCLINMPYLEYFRIVFDLPVKLVKMFISIEIPYEGALIDMDPLIVSVFFFLLHFMFQYLSNVIEEKERTYKLNVIAEKKLEEKLMNESLKKIFEDKTLEYTDFAILLTLDMKSAVDPNIAEIKEDIKELKRKNYIQVVNVIRKKYVNCKAITPGKLFMVYNNFALFDDFFTDVLKEVRKIIETNLQNNVKTDFLIALDAVKEGDRLANVLDLLEKISTFNYTNKAITTPSFNVRYKLNSKGAKYSLESMGISRFFEKRPDNTQSSVDFELFSLKSSKRAAK